MIKLKQSQSTASLSNSAVPSKSYDEHSNLIVKSLERKVKNVSDKFAQVLDAKKAPSPSSGDSSMNQQNYSHNASYIYNSQKRYTSTDSPHIINNNTSYITPAADSTRHPNVEPAPQPSFKSNGDSYNHSYYLNSASSAQITSRYSKNFSDVTIIIALSFFT